MPPSSGRHGLRRRWFTALGAMIAVLALALAGTFVSYLGSVGDYRVAAGDLSRAIMLSSQLRGEVADHEAIAHALWNGAKVDRALYVRQELAITRQFARGIRGPWSPHERILLIRAERTWHHVLASRGLYGPAAAPLPGVTLAMQQQFGSDSDAVAGLLAQLSGDAVARGSGRVAAADGQRVTVLALVLALFGLVLAVATYMARRVTNDVLRPVESLQRAAARLRDGDLEARVELDACRHADEIGELADAFNAMADALDESHRDLSHQAAHDSLTGLPNRATFEHELNAHFFDGDERRPNTVAALFIDVDDFKLVNDSLGHAGGDALLVGLAERLGGCVRPSDTVARLGGDEFAILVRDPVAAETSAVAVADRVLAAVAAPFGIESSDVPAAVSIGISVRRPETATAGQMLAEADFAMYTAKGDGKGRHRIFDPSAHDQAVARVTLRADLARAVAERQLMLEYQPIVDLRTGTTVGVEALVRWRHPSLGLLPPAEFISLAEQTGDIAAIGAWVLETAAAQLAAWRAGAPGGAGLWMAVNVSPRQLDSDESVAALCVILARPEIESAALVLEITESHLRFASEEHVQRLHRLRATGVRIALDDFGTGFSSLDRLENMPIDALKIDRSFVSGAGSGLRSEVVVETVLGLAARLGLSVTAEGIERPEQLELLRGMACQLGQGFGIARPGSASAVEALLRSAEAA